MRTATRIARLEHSRSRMILCPSCGGIDRVQSGGAIRFATLLQRVDGRALVFCKLCGECYEGRLLDPEANGAARLADVVPGVMPV